ncbi:carbon-nitrogen hydrolase family protein [Bacillus sp. HMF5848]|uniref:carbon-nitrogen hydrolase family protein n=1 Tax=Bacillus sp. HMF5848 TaxID=2495421 RepID=UPI000F784F00|nr:carbon-nitrogen hydrolase family protein [Bacillus sp. HMF5848]RSK26090.1 carbon-nitrogen hydrolase family protein [Bacillus sp. HMF5848]
MEKIKIAAIQAYGMPGEYDENFKKAEKYIQTAKEADAQCILFPELYSCGFVPNPSVWKYAETKNGPTYRFIIEMTRKYHIAIGIGYLEKVGKHYCNRYLMMAPNGVELARAEKNKSEAYVFRRGRGAHVFETQYGKIGIGLCADNHFSSFIKSMQKNNINLLIMPHALPIPKNETEIISKEDIRRIKNNIEEFPILVSNLLGVPTIFINQTGPFSSMIGIMVICSHQNRISLAGIPKLLIMKVLSCRKFERVKV